MLRKGQSWHGKMIQQAAANGRSTRTGRVPCRPRGSFLIPCALAAQCYPLSAPEAILCVVRVDPQWTLALLAEKKI